MDYLSLQAKEGHANTMPIYSNVIHTTRARCAKFRAGRNSLKINEITIVGLIFVLGCAFRKCVVPEGLATEPQQMLKIPKCLDSIDCTMALTSFICKFDVKLTTDAFKHVADLI